MNRSSHFVLNKMGYLDLNSEQFLSEYPMSDRPLSTIRPVSHIGLRKDN
jgi:hypothetical protein